MIATISLECVRGESLVTYKVADQLWEVQSALRLVYDQYLQRGLTLANEYQLRVTPWHLLSTTEVLIATAGKQVVCTASVIRDGDRGIPMESAFCEEVTFRRRMGLSLAEVSCLADRPMKGGRPFSIVRRVMKMVAQTASDRGIDRLLIVIDPRHGPFYERVLGFEPIGETKSYRAVCGHPALPMELDLVSLPIRNPRAYRTLFEETFSYDELRFRGVSTEVISLLERAVHFYSPASQPLSRVKVEAA